MGGSSSTLHGRLREAAMSNSGRAAFHFVWEGRWRTLTYGEFLRRADIICGVLKKSGVKKGDRVALLSENRPEWPAAYMAILSAGAQAVPLDARLTPPEVRNLLSDSGARCLIRSGATRRTAEEAASGMEIEVLDLEETDWNAAAGPPPEDGISEEDVASLLYTSGTTGIPKAVILTHGNFLSDADAVFRADIVRGEDNVLGVLPLHHTYPFMCTFVVPLLLGGQVTFPAGMKGPEIISAVREKGVTVLIGVPQLLELMNARIVERMGRVPLLPALVRLSGRLRRSLGLNLMGLFFRPLGRQFRFLASGGARLDPEAMRSLEALGFTVLEGYGLTETSPIVAFNPLKRRKPGSVGRPLPPAEIRIIDPGQDGVGEVAIRGPMVTGGYYNRPEETAAAFTDGWFRSGDLGYFDAEGYLFITGRSKEIIVLASGKNIYPDEVEGHYLKCPLIREMCVLEREGRLEAVIVPDTEEARARGVGNIEEALRWEVNGLSQGLPPHMRVKGVSLRSEPLPRTPLGKLRRFMVGEEMKLGARPERKAEDAALMSDPQGRTLVECVRPLMGEPAPVRATDNLELDLGIDSLSRVELAATIEQRLSIKIPEAAMAEAQTVGELLEMIKGLMEAGEVGGAAGGEGMQKLLMTEPSEEQRKKAGLKGGGLEWCLAAGAVLLLRLLMKILFRLEVRGAENIPDTPCIIAANHVSYLDGFVVGAGVPLRVFKRLYFLGIQQYFTGKLSSLFARLAHVIPIDPDAYLANALKLSSYVLRNGNSLFIFPEGGRTFDGEAMPFKKGVGILAVELGVPVVPARIDGAFEAMPRGRAVPRPRKIRLTFGPALAPGELGVSAGPEAGDRYQFFADNLRKKVIGLTYNKSNLA